MSFLFQVKHHAVTHDVELPGDATVGALQAAAYERTAVPPSGQTLLGLTKAKPFPSADVRLADLGSVKAAPKVNRLVLMGVTAERREAVQMVEATLVAEREAEREAAEREAAEAAVRQEEAARAALAAREERRLEAEREEAARLARRAARAQRAAAAAAAAMAADDDDDDHDGGAAVEQNRRLNASFDESARVELPLQLALPDELDVAPEVVRQLEHSDKVLLPAAVLGEMHAARVAPPFTFCLRVAERCVYVRAIEFSAAADTVVLSRQLVADLHAQPGATAVLTTTRLPPASKLQLEPQSSWVDIDADLRDAILLYELRNYASATLGGTLSVRYANQVYAFTVRDIEPRLADVNAVSLLDVDVEVDVVEPAQLPPPIAPLRLDAPPLAAQSARADGPAYFSLVLQQADVGQRFRVRVTASTADSDPDLFASQMSKRPSPDAYEWQSQLDGASEELTFQCGTAAGQVQPDVPLYVAVQPYDGGNGGSGECVFDIVLQRATDNRLGDGAAAIDGVECVNCGRRVPRASHALHELGCRRDNFECAVCHEILPRRSQAKHAAVRHRAVPCSLGCGRTLQQDEQAAHRRDVCPLRCVACAYCPLLVPLSNRGVHQGQCGNRTASCKRCDHAGKRNEMKRHVVEAHGVFPKDVKPTDWH